jgi:hypothetical protein
MSFRSQMSRAVLEPISDFVKAQTSFKKIAFFCKAFLQDTTSIIFNCLDSSLSMLDFKLALLELLGKTYGIKPEEIGEDFDFFHKQLLNFSPVEIAFLLLEFAEALDRN